MPTTACGPSTTVEATARASGATWPCAATAPRCAPTASGARRAPNRLSLQAQAAAEPSLRSASARRLAGSITGASCSSQLAAVGGSVEPAARSRSIPVLAGLARSSSRMSPASTCSPVALTPHPAASVSARRSAPGSSASWFALRPGSDSLARGGRAVRKHRAPSTGAAHFRKRRPAAHCRRAAPRRGPTRADSHSACRPRARRGRRMRTGP